MKWSGSAHTLLERPRKKQRFLTSPFGHALDSRTSAVESRSEGSLPSMWASRWAAWRRLRMTHS